MTFKNNAQLVRRVLGISWPRRFLLSVFVLVGVVGAVQIVVAALLKRQLPSPGVSSKASGAARVTMTPGPNAHDVDPVASPHHQRWGEVYLQSSQGIYVWGPMVAPFQPED